VKKSDDYHLRLWENTLLLKRRRDDPADELKKNMKTYTFNTYSPILNKTFTQVKTFASDSDFRLYAYALYSGNWELVSVA
jgi:hypothetical protein